MKFRRKKRDKFDISVIPMIDVFMVLLIFFMITTTFNRQAALNIQLPEAKGSEVEDDPKQVDFTIDSNGAYYVVGDDGQPRKLPDQDRETLTRELSILAAQGRNVPFIITADGKTPHQAVMTVLDVANQVGFSHISFPINETKAEE
jgi:biopolymer transport protein ExbD